LGDQDEESEINIAANSYSSSILDMLPSHVESAPHSVYQSTEKIVVKKLDSVFEELCGDSTSVYMKIDTQGFEGKVLKGAEHALKRIDTVQMEMSLVPLYEGELGFDALYSLMQDHGYTMVAMIPGFSDQNTGQLLQVDGIFHRFTS
jgi:hypothetical protein